MSFRLTSGGKLHISEDDVEKGCLAVASRRGWRVERIHCGLFRSFDSKRILRGAPTGTPDYLLVHARHPGFYLETKAPGRKLSADQESQIWTIRSLFGITVTVAHSAEEFDQWLEAYEAGP